MVPLERGAASNPEDVPRSEEVVLYRGWWGKVVPALFYLPWPLAELFFALRSGKWTGVTSLWPVVVFGGVLVLLVELKTVREIATYGRTVTVRTLKKRIALPADAVVKVRVFLWAPLIGKMALIFIKSRHGRPATFALLWSPDSRSQQAAVNDLFDKMDSVWDIDRVPLLKLGYYDRRSQR